MSSDPARRSTTSLGAQRVLAVAWTQPDDRVVGVEAVEPRLAAHGVAVGRERRVLDDDAVALSGRSVERHHQQVQVDRQRVHDHGLVRLGADESGGRLGQQRVVRQPRAPGLEVSLDAELGPVVEVLEQLGRRSPWAAARASCRRSRRRIGITTAGRRRDVEQVAVPGVALVEPRAFASSSRCRVTPSVLGGAEDLRQEELGAVFLRVREEVLGRADLDDRGRRP